MVWNKEKDLDKALLVNQVALFLQTFCFMIELLAFPVNNVKLCRSFRYCSCLTRFGSMFPFISPGNIKNLWLSDVSKKYKKVTLTSPGSILVICRNYNVLQSFCFLFLFDQIFLETIRTIVKDELAAHEAAIKKLINSNMKSANEWLDKLSTEVAELTKSLEHIQDQ